jgi:hypothetical protein
MGRLIMLRSLEQLYPHVIIETKEDALRFVRLRTAPTTWYLWRTGSPVELRVEVCDPATAQTMPNFGLRGGLVLSPYLSGYMGVLPQRDWDRYNFTAATVEHVQDTFAVRRWILQQTWTQENPAKDEVLFVEETLGGRRGYELRVLRRLPAAKFEGVRWSFQAFR